MREQPTSVNRLEERSGSPGENFGRSMRRRSNSRRRVSTASRTSFLPLNEARQLSRDQPNTFLPNFAWPSSILSLNWQERVSNYPCFFREPAASKARHACPLHHRAPFSSCYELGKKLARPSPQEAPIHEKMVFVPCSDLLKVSQNV